MHAQMVAGQPSAAPRDKAPAAQPDEVPSEDVTLLQRRYQKLMSWGNIAFVGGGIIAMVCLVILMGLSNKLAQNPNPALAWSIVAIVVGLLASLVGFLLPILAAKSSPKASTDQQWSQPTVLPQAPTTTRLPPEHWPEQMPSVTESTTELIEASSSKVTVRSEEPHRRAVDFDD